MSAKVGVALIFTLWILYGGMQRTLATQAPFESRSKNAYATMLYMGTPRDYEFFVAARVLLRSLAKLEVNADLVVIASSSVPLAWRKDFKEDGVRVVIVEDIPNPYASRPHFQMRFKLTLNKIYAWTLIDYERVVMLDVDNVFLQKADELFTCGQFCAAFINPCIFHTGLFVLEPSNDTFNSMLDDIRSGRPNRDGADQGFLVSQFPDLLDMPMFHPPLNGSKLKGNFRLPVGYQMDASQFYLKLKWRIPCGPNSVVTFPSVPLLKPWYWWSYPILPLGLLWHEQRRSTIGYGSEMRLMAVEAIFYSVTMILALIWWVRRSDGEKTPIIKSCLERGSCSSETTLIIYCYVVRAAAILTFVCCFMIPFVMVPTTVHPLMGWAMWLLGSLSLLIVTTNIFQLSLRLIFTPWLGFLGALLVMAAPFFADGIIRALAVFAYAFLAAPFFWWTIKRAKNSVNATDLREPLMVRTVLKSEPHTEFNLMKLC